jgi:hypothetical protein
MRTRKVGGRNDPRPVTVIAAHLEDLTRVYQKARLARMEPLDALLAAIERTLRRRERQEVLAYLSGRSDDTFGAGAGDALMADLLQSFEHTYRQTLAASG